jgi:hypothetical protein
MPSTAAAASWRPVQPENGARETARSAKAAPMIRSQATVVGSTSSNSRMAIVAPTYWATAERMNSASGEAVSRNRVTAPGGRVGAVSEVSRTARGRCGRSPARAAGS